jgi:hypothetical protein
MPGLEIIISRPGSTSKNTLSLPAFDDAANANATAIAIR